MGTQVHAITFGPDHCRIQFMDVPTDVRDEGRVVLTRQLELLYTHPDYREASRRIHDRIVALIEDASDNAANSEPYDPEEDADLDEDLGMGQ